VVRIGESRILQGSSPLASGKSWRDYVLGEAEKYKDKLPVAAEILSFGERFR
jgi:hypothetical protein